MADLTAVLNTYQDWLEPFSDESTRQHAALDCTALETALAPLNQQLEEQLATDEIGTWQRLYFQEQRGRRERNLLQNNLACLIDWRSTQWGLKRLAYFIAALLLLHRHHSDQQPLLRGFIHRSASADIRNRHFLLLHRGKAWRLAASDNSGLTANPVQIENALYAILHGSHPDEGEIPFTAYSFADEHAFPQIKGRLRARPANKILLEQIREAWFSVAIDDHHQSDLHDALIGAAFKDTDSFFSYKPLNYRCNIVDNRYYLHSETTWANPLQLARLLAQTQEYYDRQAYDCRNGLPADLACTPLAWELDEALQAEIEEQLDHYDREADSYYSTSCDIFLTNDARHTLEQIGPPPLLALAFQYAQWRNLKTIRSVNGLEWGDINQRVQLTSTAAIRLAEALYAESEEVKSLWQDYVQEYERRLVGTNPYQYLQGLQELARAKRLDLPFFHSKHYQTETCLSISTNCTLKNLLLVPEGENAFALSYQLRRNNISVLITHKKKRTPAVQRYCREFKYALKQLLRLLA